MSEFKMKELLGTQYLYISILKDMNHVFNTIRELRRDKDYAYFAGNSSQEQLFQEVKAGTPVTIDISQMKITSDCTRDLANAQMDGIDIVDRLNPQRNRLLTINTERRSVHPETVKLPEYDASMDLIQFVKSLNKDVVYQLPPALNEQTTALVILATLVRPKLQFELRTNHGTILEAVSDIIPVSVLSKYDEFYYYSPEGIEIIKATDGMVQTQRGGLCTISEACECGSLVPTVFGQKQLHKDPDWEPLMKVCLHVLNSMKVQKETSLDDILKGVQK